MTTTPLVTVIGGLFVVIGAGLTLVAVRHGMRRLTFMQKSAVVDGVVVALREDRDGMDTVPMRSPRVRFRTASGRDISFEAGIARSGAAWQVGETVRVRYRVEHPETAELDSFVALWGPAVVFAVLALAFLGVGLSAWLGFIPG